MTIRVQQALLARLRDQDTVQIQVRSPAAARLGAAVQAAVSEIEDISWPVGGGDEDQMEVSEPVPIPGGYVFMADLANTPAQIGGSIPDILTRHLTQAGITEAEIGLAARMGRRYRVVETFTPAARAWLRWPARTSQGDLSQAAAGLAGAAAEWLRAEQQPGMELAAQIVSSEIPLSWDALPTVVRDTLAARDMVSVLVSDFATAAAAAVFGGYFGTVLILTAAGASWQPADVAVRMRGQRDVLRGHAGAAEWAGVTAQAGNRHMLDSEWYDPDEMRPQPMWYQILSPAHVGYLGRTPPGSVELAEGRVELTVGEPEDWVPGSPRRGAVEAQAAALLAPST
jgi:hypothetical protein